MHAYNKNMKRKGKECRKKNKRIRKEKRRKNYFMTQSSPPCMHMQKVKKIKIMCILVIIRKKSEGE